MCVNKDNDNCTSAVVIVLVYVHNILTRMEMGSLFAICDQFSTTATARLRVPDRGHTNCLNFHEVDIT